MALSEPVNMSAHGRFFITVPGRVSADPKSLDASERKYTEFIIL